MKHFFRHTLVAALAVLLLGCGSALADEAPAISVQLDGQTLAFTDAVPQAREGRTFLPFRAVFEAMGAQVDWDGAAGTVSATRDGATVTMTLGSTAATVEKDGASTPLEMDVAPFVENNRTYVPVRFAAQAFGCSVGWDGDAMTAVIVDADKLVDSALEGKTFTYVEELSKYSEKFSQGIWNTEMTMTGSLSVTEQGLPITIPMEVSAAGITQDQTKLQMDMSLSLDLTQALAAMSQASGEAVDPQDLAALQTLAGGLDMSLRGDLAAGQLSMGLPPILTQAMGMPAGVWLSMDLAQLAQDQGLSWSDLLTQATQPDAGLPTLLRSALKGQSVDSVQAYEGMKTMAGRLANLFSDEYFVREGDAYTSSLTLEDAGSFQISLTKKDGVLTGWSMSLTVSAPAAADGSTPAADLSMTLAMDDKDRFSGKMTLASGEELNMDLTISGGYTQGDAAPVTTPPDGVFVIPITPETLAAFSGTTSGT